jgi:flavin-dependent dehydrogenase
MRDVIVIGGGPAGSTAATLLAQQGFSVTLLERERFPRFQIGESLLPYNNDLFNRLGVTGQLHHAAETGEFFPKYGAYFVTGDGSIGYGFRFDKRLEDPYRNSFQVKRAEFDQLLLKNAAKHGVEVVEEANVVDVDVQGDRCSVGFKPTSAGRPEADTTRLEARFVIDASGHGAILGNRVGEKTPIDALKKIALFAHYRNVPRPEGRDAGSTVIVVLRNAWFWLIPVSADVMSVGLVVDRDHLLRCGLEPQELLDRTIARSPWVAEKMKDAEQITQIYARKDFSFRMKNMVGPNYALIGDAAGFIDPIFSTGVFMAMKSADMAVAAIAKRLRTGSMAELESYEKRMSAGLDKYLRFIEHFYQREFLEVFLQPSERWGLLNAIVGVLAGDIFETRNNRFKLALFFALVKLQKWRAVIAPRIAWESLPAAAAKL